MARAHYHTAVARERGELASQLCRQRRSASWLAASHLALFYPAEALQAWAPVVTLLIACLRADGVRSPVCAPFSVKDCVL